MLTVKPKFEAKGKFKIERTGPSGHLIHEQENLVTDVMFNNFFNTGIHLYSKALFDSNYSNLYIGDGNAEPKPSDNALTHRLWQVGISEYSTVCNEDFNIAQIMLTFILPATSAYVGIIRELGIGGSEIQTHALLKDAEGNPYEINKTDTDQVTIIYTVYVSMDPYALCCFAFPDRFSIITGYFTADYTGISLLFKLQHYEIFNKCLYVNSSATVIAKTATANLTVNKTTKTATIATSRIAAESTYNGHYILSIGFENVSHNSGFMNYINLPNLEAMPQAKLEDYSVGVGDGQTESFIPPIPLWDEGTEEIYINGILQQRNIDYTCDCKHNLQNNPELLPLMHALILQEYDTIGGRPITIFPSDLKLLSERTLYCYAFDSAFNKKSSGSFSTDGGEVIFSLPLEYDFINWNIADIYFATNVNNSSSIQAYFTVEVSDDLQSWESIFEDLPAKKGTRSYAYDRPLSDWDTFHLEQSIKKKYWKLKITGTLSSAETVGFFLMPTKGEPIKFTKAPEEGAIITMNAKSSLPYKDDKHIIDYSGVIQL